MSRTARILTILSVTMRHRFQPAHHSQKVITI